MRSALTYSGTNAARLGVRLRILVRDRAAAAPWHLLGCVRIQPVPDPMDRSDLKPQLGDGSSAVGRPSARPRVARSLLALIGGTVVLKSSAAYENSR